MANLFNFLTIFLLILFFNTNQFSMFSLSYYSFVNLNLFSFGLSVLMDLISMKFIVMVIPVTFFVLAYSKIYMENYNNKKFLFLLILFFLSMFILVSSNSPLNLMLGWDGLGLTSICLIMFYPNKTSLYNSVLTMFFNRLGDVFMIISIGLLMSSYSDSSSFNFSSKTILTILIICAFSKSAQFPLSSWLPAAMSAPTPISAMVHSSTLVTAGVYIFCKSNFFIFSENLYCIPLAVSILTFLVGGSLANSESDSKKIVAFSTMSQISMMICFCFMLNFIFSMTHMFFHAFFKTMLFVSCGSIFMVSFSAQMKKNILKKSMDNLINLTFFLSIFMMTGFLFSSSFFSKDEYLELMIYSNEMSSFMMIIMGSVLTIFYCIFILVILKKGSNSVSSFSEKKTDMMKLFTFSILMIFLPFFIKKSLTAELSPLVSWIEMNILTIFLSAMMLMKFSPNPTLKKMSTSILFMKDYTYSLMGKILMNKNSSESTATDLMIFKPKLISFTKSMKNMKMSTLKLTMVIMISSLII